MAQKMVLWPLQPIVDRDFVKKTRVFQLQIIDAFDASTRKFKLHHARIKLDELRPAAPRWPPALRFRQERPVDALGAEWRSKQKRRWGVVWETAGPHTASAPKTGDGHENGDAMILQVAEEQAAQKATADTEQTAHEKSDGGR